MSSAEAFGRKTKNLVISRTLYKYLRILFSEAILTEKLKK